MELKTKDKQWRFTFTSSEKGEYVCKYNPLEHLETEYALIREDEGAIMFTFSGDYTWPKDGYDYLKSGLDSYGILWNCFLTIEYINNYTFEYETLISLKKLDFTRIVKDDSTNGITIKVPLTDSKFYENIKAREDEEIPYSRLETLDGETITPFANEYEDVTVYGVELTSVGNGTGTDIEVESDINGTQILLDLAFESNNTDIKSVTGRIVESLGPQVLLTTADCLYYTDNETTIDFEYTFNYNADDIDNYSDLYIWIGEFDEDGEYINVPTLIDSNRVTTNGNYTLTGSYSGTISAMHGIFIVASQFDASTFAYTVYDTSVMTLTVYEKAASTVIQHVTLFQIHQRLIEAITGESDAFEASVFDTGGKWAHLYASNGYLYRQFPATATVPAIDGEVTAQLTFKLKELQDNMRKMLNVEYGIIESGGVKKIICEDKSYFYQNTLGHNVTKTKRNSLSKELDINLFYSSIIVGTPKKDYEETGALKSYANLCSYSTCLGTFKNELDLSTTYFVDPIWAESARRLPINATETTDSAYDNDIFILETINDGGLVQRTDENFYAIDGIDEITTPMNLNLVPSRCLYRHGSWIRIGLALYLDKDIKFNKSEIKNTLSTVRTDESNAISENVDIDPTYLDVPYLTGYKIKVLADVSMDDISLIEADPYKLIQLPDTIDGENVQIFLNQISNKPIGDNLNNIEGYEYAGVVAPAAHYWEWLTGDSIEWLTGDGIELIQ